MKIKGMSKERVKALRERGYSWEKIQRIAEGRPGYLGQKPPGVDPLTELKRRANEGGKVMLGTEDTATRGRDLGRVHVEPGDAGQSEGVFDHQATLDLLGKAAAAGHDFLAQAFMEAAGADLDVTG